MGRVPARFVLVVGKGGVGKTTTAGAIALGLADSGVETRLLSTDPAPSLADLFPAGSCSPHLAIEELDAAAYASGWIARARAPLLELFDRGTYLDARDVEGFLDLSLPGVDEIAAVLRLSDLAADGPPRVVVDTAPTGHTLRLLDAPALLDRWTGAFQAMEEKAIAVISGITRREIRLAAASVIRDLEERVERFRREVLARADVVIVERSGALVRAESERLAGALAARGLRVAAHVHTEEAGEAPLPATEPVRIRIPWREGLVGCDGLRRWGEAGPVDRKGTADPRGEPAAPRLRADPADLLLFVGKGGVGKTTCAAAAAVALSAERDVLLLGTDPAGSLGDVLARAIPVEGDRLGRLEVREIQANDRFEAFRERYRQDVEDAFARIGASEGLALDRRVVASLLELAPPGADEIFAVLALLEEARPGRLLVVDTAPTGHLLRLLAMPKVALDWTHQLMRVLLRYRSALGLDAFAERLLDFAKQLKDLNLRLHDPARTAAFVVSLPGPLVEAQTARLERRLGDAGVRVGGRLLNRWTGRDAAPGSGRIPTDEAREDTSLRIRVPLCDPPPIGPARLADFFQRWTVAP